MRVCPTPTSTGQAVLGPQVLTGCYWETEPCREGSEQLGHRPRGDHCPVAGPRVQPGRAGRGDVCAAQGLGVCREHVCARSVSLASPGSGPMTAILHVCVCVRVRPRVRLCNYVF